MTEIVVHRYNWWEETAWYEWGDETYREDLEHIQRFQQTLLYPERT